MKFSADTVVAVDGSVVRTAGYSAVDGNFREAQERYALSPGGSWSETTEKYPLPNVKEPAPEITFTHVYTAVSRVTRGVQLPTDFVRKARNSEESARNAIKIETHHYWFADTYQYQETFADIVSYARLAARLTENYDFVLRALAEQIAESPAAQLTVEAALERIRKAWHPVLDEALATLRRECFPVSKTFGECEAAMSPYLQGEKIERIIDEQLLLDDLVKLFPAPAEAQQAEWRDMLAREVIPPFEARFGRYLEEIDPWLDENYCGAHCKGLLIGSTDRKSTRLNSSH